MKKVLISLLLIFVFNHLFCEEIFFSANSMTGQAGNSNSTTNLLGEAFVQTESMKIQADSIELSGEDYRFINADGKVSGQNFSSNLDFSCDSLSYDRTTKIATLFGNVNLKDNDNDVTAKAQMIEYNQTANKAILQIKIDLKQKENQCTGSYAVYLKNEQILELSGNAQIKQKDDTFRAQHISLNMETQEITLDGNVRGSIKETKSENSSDENEKSDSEKNNDLESKIEEQGETQNE